MPLTTFQSCEIDLEARLSRQRPPLAKQPGSLPSTLIRQRYALLRFGQSLLHHPERNYARWREDALDTLRHCLILPDCLNTPSLPVLLSRDESHPTYTVEELEITVTPPLRAPATVVIPRNGATRHPAVLLLHSMGGYQLYGREKLLARSDEAPFLTRYREVNYDGLSLQKELADAGYLSIAIDAIDFGLRSSLAGSMGPEAFDQWRREIDEPQNTRLMLKQRGEADHTLSRTMLALGYSTAALVASDDLRTVDYLLTRPDVDPARIGCAGLSFGAFRTNYLAAIDPRVRLGISVCWHSTMAGVINYNPEGALGFFALPPGFFRHFDLADIVALAAPKPFLAISGWDDPMLEPFGIAQAHRFYRRVWERAGTPENLGSMLYDTGHRFSRPMQECATSFLNRHLA